MADPVAPVPVAEAPPAAAPVVPAAAPATPPAPAASLPPTLPEAQPTPVIPPVAAEAPPPAVVPERQGSLLQQFDKEQAKPPEAPSKPAEAPSKEAAPSSEAEKPAAEGAKEGEKPPGPEKPVEVKAEDKPAEKPVEAKPAEPAKPEPREVKFEYKLPEHVSLPEPMQAELHSTLTNFMNEPTGANQQALVDFHFARINDAIREYHDESLRQFNAYNEAEAKKFRENPRLGGRAYNTSMGAIAAVRDGFISDDRPGSKGYEADIQRWNDWDNRTGAGSASIFLEFLHRISRYMNEPEMRGTEDIKPIIQAEIPGGRAPIYKTSFKNR